MKPVCLIACATMLFSLTAEAADPAKIDGPIYATTYIEVAPGAAATTLNALREYRKTSVQEGAKAADIFQENGQPGRFVVSEIWSDPGTFATHEKAPSFSALAEKLKPVSFKPIDIRPHTLYWGTPYAPPRAGDFFVISHLDVYGPGVPVLQAAFRPLAGETRNDKGMVRYEILDQVVPHANHFRLFEEWSSEKDWVTHNLSAHVQAFHAALPQYLGTPYDQRLYHLAN
jgi:quinol monooxygenase YgiN